MPNVGDVVYVSERDSSTGDVTVSPALVTHVYTEDDGDRQWWNNAKEKGIVDATVFPRGAASRSVTVGKAEQITDNEGNEYSVGYATSPDGFDGADSTEGTTFDGADSTEGTNLTPNTAVGSGVPTTNPEAAGSPANGGTGTAGDLAATSGAQTDTVGDGTAPQGSGTDTAGNPSA